MEVTLATMRQSRKVIIEMVFMENDCDCVTGLFSPGVG